MTAGVDRSRTLPRPLMAVAVAAALLAAASCSGGEDSARGECPTEPVKIVVTVDQWTDIVTAIAGDCAGTTTIVAGGAQDPHDFEPTPADIAAFSSADLVVMNGLGYDEWASQTLDALDSAPPVIDVSEIAGRSPGANPHLWYDPRLLEPVAVAVNSSLDALAPEASAYFRDRYFAWSDDKDRFDEVLDAIDVENLDGSFAATEPVYDEMAIAVGLSDRTPEGYRGAALNRSDPSPADLNQFEQRLEDGDIDVLIVNTQSEGSTSSGLRATAEANGIPVVEITESQPDDAESFWDWQIDQLDSLAAAVRR